MLTKEEQKISKHLSLILRHKPEAVGIELDSNGWVRIDALLKALAKHGSPLTLEQLDRVVELNDKKRFTVADGKIRAAQGHSVRVDLNIEEKTPPDTLYHGTALKFLDSIFEKGLLPMKRQHVHLSDNEETAKKVGSRHGTPVVLAIAANEMLLRGCKFWLSDNGVWLTDKVESRFIRAFFTCITSENC